MGKFNSMWFVQLSRIALKKEIDRQFKNAAKKDK